MRLRISTNFCKHRFFLDPQYVLFGPLLHCICVQSSVLPQSGGLLTYNFELTLEMNEIRFQTLAE